jgi:ABC-2 type transport system ATP-binding protein
VIEVDGLTKQFGTVRAVDDLTFEVAAGSVTGFLGPNGAGKSTTMRIVMGLDQPSAGTALVNGRAYADLASPLRQVGALLDAGAMHPGRTGRGHLRVAARTNAMFDEPVNGLDLDGVRWIRSLLRGFADEGRTVLVSSHLVSEMQLIADRIIIIGRGRLIADAPTAELLRGLGGQRVRVVTPRVDELRGVLSCAADGAGAVERTGHGELEVRGLAAPEIGDLAHAHGLPLHHLAEVEQSLEHAYLSLTEASVDHHGQVPQALAGGLADGVAR